MDTKAAFEKWWEDRNDGDSRFETSPHGSYVANDIEDAWTIWQASRTAIEIELPNGYISPSMHMYQQVMVNIRDVAKAITSHGIRIKGKTE